MNTFIKNQNALTLSARMFSVKLYITYTKLRSINLRCVLFFIIFLQVKVLCRQWFPVEYPDAWYEDITSSPRFYALAALNNDKIMGLLVAETKTLSKLSKEAR